MPAITPVIARLWPSCSTAQNWQLELHSWCCCWATSTRGPSSVLTWHCWARTPLSVHLRL